MSLRDDERLASYRRRLEWRGSPYATALTWPVPDTSSTPSFCRSLDANPTSRLSAETLISSARRTRRGAPAGTAARARCPDVDVSEQSIPGPDGAPEVRVLVYVPRNAARPMPALVWIHGGGYVMGTPGGRRAQDEAAGVAGRLHGDLGGLSTGAGSPVSGGCGGLLRRAALDARAVRRARAWTASGWRLVAPARAVDWPPRWPCSRATAASSRSRFNSCWCRCSTIARSLPPSRTHSPVSSGGRPATTSSGGRRCSATHRAVGCFGVRRTRAGGVIGRSAADVHRHRRTGPVPRGEHGVRAASGAAGVPVELHVYPGAYHGFSRAAEARVTQAYVRDHTQALQRVFEQAPVRELAQGVR